MISIQSLALSAPIRARHGGVGPRPPKAGRVRPTGGQGEGGNPRLNEGAGFTGAPPCTICDEGVAATTGDGLCPITASSLLGWRGHLVRHRTNPSIVRTCGPSGVSPDDCLRRQCALHRRDACATLLLATLEFHRRQRRALRFIV